jgi:hypothetical protein
MGPARWPLVVALLLLPVQGTAQSIFWAGYGQNADQASGLATGEHLSVGWALARPAAGLMVGVGVPVDAGTSSRWGSVGAWFDTRPGQRTTGVGVRGSGTAFAFDDPVVDAGGAGSVAAAEAYAALAAAGTRIEARAGGRHGVHGGAGNVTQRLLGRLGGGAVRALGVLELAADVDHWLAEEGSYTQVGGRVSLHQPRFQAWAGLEHWLDGDLGPTGWAAGVRVPVTNRVAVTARGGLQAADVLFWVPAQRTFSLGVQLRTGGDPLASALPVPPVRDATRPVTLTLPAGAAEAPAVAGTFSGWERIPMQRVGNEWRAELTLTPGVHEYSFVAADGTWFVPDGTPGRKPDGFGGYVAVVIVR